MGIEIFFFCSVYSEHVCMIVLCSRLTMVVFICPVTTCNLRFKQHAKLADHWRRIHVKTVKLQSCVGCRQTFRTINKAVAHIKKSGKEHWVKEICVTNRNFLDPVDINFEDFKTEKTPREIAAEERRAKALAFVPETAILYGRSGNAINRDEEVVLRDGHFVRQRKVSERKNYLLPPQEPEILDYNDDYLSFTPE